MTGVLEVRSESCFGARSLEVDASLILLQCWRNGGRLSSFSELCDEGENVEEFEPVEGVCFA